MKKNILLIGGSHGIGRSIAQQLHETRALFIASRSQEGLEDIQCQYIPFDVTKDNLDLSVLPEVLHGFVYCPGSINLKPFKMMNLEVFEEDMKVNFLGLVKVVKEIIPKMDENASMVFFSTVAVAKGMAFHTSVAGSKGAIEGFAKSLAAEYAPKLRVNVIAPSLVDTPLAAKLLNNERKIENMAGRHPLKRVGHAEDIAHMAVFLLSERSNWMTGQVVRVDGGMSTLSIS
ncbi:SDR family NAD(P)-dependent oxidoreductase [Ulvibacterium sp.]|uniref:SDR family NAD(P)-dependent oxidoreductase n=1 Tax=Ulvibacterium sp. TaxID=2665914 RepID=UPI002616A577|nr:SDR family oxidoreductase [Ulvibacterium sp.]